MNEQELNLYLADVEKLIEQLTSISEAINSGDYTTRLDVRSKFTSLCNLERSVNQIIEFMELNTNITLIGENSLMNDFILVFSAFANRDFSRKIEISERGTILDAIGAGINMLGEELENSTVSKNELEVERNRLHHSQEIARIGDWEYFPATSTLICSQIFLDVLELSACDYSIIIKELEEKLIFNDEQSLNIFIDKMVQTDVNNYEFSFIARSGKVKYINNIISHIYDDKGRPIGYKGVVQDITELKESQLRLSYQIELQKFITEMSSLFVGSKENIRAVIEDVLSKCNTFFDVDRSYYLHFNELSMNGLVVYEANTKYVNYDTLSLFDKSPDLFDICVYTVKNNEVIQYYDAADVAIETEKTMLHQSAVKSFITIPVYGDEKGFAIYGMDVIRNHRSWTEEEINGLKIISNIISDALHRDFFENKLISAREKAEESDRLKTAFLMNMSHEIRTPMNGILGFLPLLQEQTLAEEERHHYIDIVNRSGLRLLDTINDIIEISRIEAGEMELNLSTVDICETLQYQYDFFTPQAEDKGLKLIMNNKLLPEQCFIKTDKNKVESILTNLVKNAIKFTEKGHVEIEAKINKNKLFIYVRDTGIGIPQSRIDAIFERFVQADIKLTRAHEGSGLGLSIAKAYTKALDGTIHVESEFGVGSCFCVILPLVVTEKNSTLEVKGAGPILHEENLKNTILIAEDDQISFEFLNIILSKKGYDLIHVENGEDCVKAFKENPQIALILMDIKMPGIDGLEATRLIRKWDKNIPIIAQTAHAFSGEREKAFIAGCSDYLTKPIKRAELLSKISEYIN